MTPPRFYIPKAENNIKLQLVGAVSAASTAAAFDTGEGAALPVIVRGQATSLGDETTLNDTGGFAGAVVSEGDVIENLTDGSVAVVLEITSDDSIRTTPLEGGSDNTWQNSDVWAVGCYVGTLTQLNASGLIVKQERVKVTDRASDTITMVRQYDGDASQSFNAGDWFYIMVEKSVTNEARKAFANLLMRIEDLYRGTPHYAAATGSSNAFAISLPRKFNQYTDFIGLDIVVKANHTISGGATINVDGLGAKTIYKQDGVTALVSGDIQNGQVFTIAYNGSAFQMTSPIGQAGAAPITGDYFGDGSDGSYTLDGTQAAVAGLFSKSSNTYTLLRDAYFTDLTITSSPAVTLNTAGFRIFVNGTLTLNGTISSKGADGTIGGNGANSAGSPGTGGPGGTAPSGFFKAAAGANGGNGGVGWGPTAVGSGLTGGTGPSVTNSFGGNGALGGQGGSGQSGPGGAGGAGPAGPAGSVTNPPTSGGNMRNLWQASLWKVLLDGSNAVTPYWGAGAGGGGGGGGSGQNPGASGGGGGGGGAAAYPLYVAARTITGSGTFDGRGGNGGNGGNGGTSAGTGGAGAGGGGGHGAPFIKIYNDDSGFSGSVLLTGGVGGTKGTGNGGNNGPNGSDGTTLSFRVQ